MDNYENIVKYKPLIPKNFNPESTIVGVYKNGFNDEFNKKGLYDAYIKKLLEHYKHADTHIN